MSAGTILKLNFLIIAFVLVIIAMVELKSGGLTEGAQALFGVHPVQTESSGNNHNSTPRPSGH